MHIGNRYMHTCCYDGELFNVDTHDDIPDLNVSYAKFGIIDRSVVTRA